jgi:hypothetical protein
MKRITLLGLAGIAFVSLSQPTWAGPRGGGGGFSGGGHSGGGGRVGGFSGGGSRAAPALYGGGVRTAPAFRGAYFTGRNVARPNAAPRFYSGGNRMAAVRPRGSTRSVPRSTSRYAGRITAATRQPTRVGSTPTAARHQLPRTDSIPGRNRISDSRPVTAGNRQFVKNHASEKHAGNWRRDWDRHHAHFHNNRVFVFVDGFWWGLNSWDYYPYYADGYYPNDYASYYPYDYDYSSGSPYGYYDDYYPYSNNDQPAYAGSTESGANPSVSAVQSELAKLGYYNGAIDGILGDQTEAALAHYQEDRDLSVTGTVDAATLQSFGIR